MDELTRKLFLGELKEHISRIGSLAFNVNDRTRLVADASPIALGAVLIQYKKWNSPTDCLLSLAERLEKS